MGSPASTEESIGLFMLRKDSERRATLHRILTDDINHVVSNIQESLPQVGGGKRQHVSSWINGYCLKIKQVLWLLEIVTVLF